MTFFFFFAFQFLGGLGPPPPGHAPVCILPLKDGDTRTRIAELMTMRKVQVI